MPFKEAYPTLAKFLNIFFIVGWILIIFAAIDYWFIYDRCIVNDGSSPAANRNEGYNMLYGSIFLILMVMSISLLVSILARRAQNKVKDGKRVIGYGKYIAMVSSQIIGLLLTQAVSAIFFTTCS
jgi:glucan phosphoethanolaminetransferase (alkaline phosphatase superfamily)